MTSDEEIKTIARLAAGYAASATIDVKDVALRAITDFGIIKQHVYEKNVQTREIPKSHESSEYVKQWKHGTGTGKMPRSHE